MDRVWVKTALLVVGTVAVAVLLTQTAMWEWFLRWAAPAQKDVLYPSATVLDYAVEHLRLVGVSSAITVALGLGLGISVTRSWGRPLLPLASDAVSLAQTFPPVAVLALAVPVMGFGFWPSVVALVLYGLLPVLRNTIAGLEGVPPDALDAARGVGMTPRQILAKVELPMATRVIAAGIRTSVVINVGTAAIAATIGAGGLGVPIVGGLVAQNAAFVLEGAIPTALLAILLDAALGLVESALLGRGLREA